MKRVSVVVPTYNQARYLPICLDHLLHQDYPNLEIIVADDASTDDTREVLKKYVDGLSEKVSFASRYDGAEVRRDWHFRYPQDRMLHVIRHEKNLGATRNYNSGLERATGEYVTFVVADDVPHPSMISTLVGELERTGADFVFSDMFIVDDAGRVLRKFALPDYAFQRSFADWYLCGVSKLFRRELVAKFGAFDPSYAVANDYELFLRYAMKGARFHHVPKVLYSIRHHGADRQTGQHSEESTRKMWQESIELARRAREWAGRAT